MGNSVLIATVLSVVLTPLVSLLKREHWSDELKFLVAVAISGLVAVAQVVFGNNVHSFHEMFALWGTALATTQVTYKLYFKDSKLDDLVTAVGSK